MIMKPSECEPLLSEAVVLARITKSQHTRLLTAPVHQLATLGAERYDAAHITLVSAT